MKLEPRDEFYMVWRQNTCEVIFQHPTYGSAVDEAKRLAKKCPKEKLFVLKAINVFTHIDVNTAISISELIELPDAVIAQLSKGMQKKILAIRAQIQDWSKIDCDCGSDMLVHKVECPRREV